MHAYKKKSLLKIKFFHFAFGTRSHCIDKPYLELTELCLTALGTWIKGMHRIKIKTELKFSYQIDLNKESGGLICHEP